MRPPARRSFLKSVAAGALPQVKLAAAPAVERSSIGYPRMFSGPELAMLAFPLGGVGAGSISLGGRGQLRDWEIFNKPDKGRSPAFSLPAVWCGTESRVLEERRWPP